MAVVFSNNATTVLSSNITNSATSIAVQDGSVFPTLSGTDYFYATLQDPGNTKREIVKVTARSGNTLTVTRAVDGSSASAFSANDAFELRLNAAALNDAVNSGTADLELNSFTGDGSEVDFTLSMEALEANTLVYIDGVYQNKTAYSISGYVLTFSAAPDNGAAIEVTTATVAPIQESTDFLLNQFTGDGSDTTFTLSSSPEENQTTVFISGVYQSKSNYSISGTTLTFSTAPPASSSIEVMVARTVVYGIGTPSNDTVSTAKIVDGAVTPAKLSLTYATETYVGTAVSNLVDSSPAALDTLNELAAALGDDPNFATTVTNSIALKAPLASPSFTGTATVGGLTVDGTTGISVNGSYAVADLMETDITDKNTRLITSGGEFRIDTLSDDKSSSTKRFDIEHSTGDISFYDDSGNAKFFWDASAESLGIGTSSPFFTTAGRSSLSVNGTSSSILAFGKGGSSENYILADVGGFTIANTSATLPTTFFNNGAERVRIDGAGNVALMTDGADIKLYYTEPRTFITNSGPSVTIKQIDNHSTGAYIDFAAWDNSSLMRLMNTGNLLVGQTSNAETGTGIGLVPDGTSHMYSGGTDALMLGRGGSDGDILSFNKSGTTIGDVGVNNNNNLRIQGNSSHCGLEFGTNAIYPHKNSANVDNQIDLGESGLRYKDLYLSGGVYLGGTGAANKLDDYESGTWTPSFSAAGSPSYTTQYGRYTKIGRVVYCSIAIRATSVSGSATIQLSGLPFTPSDTSDAGQRSTYSPSLGGHCSGLSEATGRFRVSSGTDMFGVKGVTTTTYMTAAEFSSGGSPQITGDFWYYTS